MILLAREPQVNELFELRPPRVTASLCGVRPWRFLDVRCWLSAGVLAGGEVESTTLKLKIIRLADPALLRRCGPVAIVARRQSVACICTWRHAAWRCRCAADAGGPSADLAGVWFAWGGPAEMGLVILRAGIHGQPASQSGDRRGPCPTVCAWRCLLSACWRLCCWRQFCWLMLG